MHSQRRNLRMLRLSVSIRYVQVVVYWLLHIRLGLKSTCDQLTIHGFQFSTPEVHHGRRIRCRRSRCRAVNVAMTSIARPDIWVKRGRYQLERLDDWRLVVLSVLTNETPSHPGGAAA